MIEEVYDFNEKVLKIINREFSSTNGMLSPSEQLWLTQALLEEIVEFGQAKTAVDRVDALLDLCYFAIGGLVRMGVTREQARACFDTIHAANMKKTPGIKANRPQDGSVTDAVKEKGFVSPEVAMREILK